MVKEGSARVILALVVGSAAQTRLAHVIDSVCNAGPDAKLRKTREVVASYDANSPKVLVGGCEPAGGGTYDVGMYPLGRRPHDGGWNDHLYYGLLLRNERPPEKKEKEMNRNVTAVYRTYAVADLVRRELEELGVSRANIHIVPDTDNVVGASGYREDRRWLDELHELHLPDDDVRTYQQCVRRGDYVVSANVDDDYVQRALQIMRRPEAEAYDLNARSGEFRNDTLVGHSDTARAVSDPRYIGQRDTEYTDPYVRSYRRDAPLSAKR